MNKTIIVHMFYRLSRGGVAADVRRNLRHDYCKRIIELSEGACLGQINQKSDTPKLLM